MPRLVNFNGRLLQFDDNTPDEHIAEALTFIGETPKTMDVIKAIPGEAKRQLGEFAAGGARALGDITGSQGMVDDAIGARQAIAAERQEETPPNMNIAQEGLMTGGASMLATAPILAGSLAAAPLVGAGALSLGGLAGAGTTAGGIMTGVTSYGKGRESGLSGTQATIYGAIDGLIEKYTEHLPLKDFGTAKTLTEALTLTAKKFVQRELLGEELATIGQYANEKISLGTNQTLGEMASELGRQMAVTAFAVGTAGPVQAGIMHAGGAALGHLTPDSPAPAIPAPPGLSAPPNAPEPAPAGVTPPLAPEAQGTPVAVPTAEVAAPPAPTVEKPPEAPPAVVAKPTVVTEGSQVAEQTPTPDLPTMAATLRPVPPGAMRLYTILWPEQSGITMWTTDLGKIQEIVDEYHGGPQEFQVAYWNINPQELASRQAGLTPEALAKVENPTTDFVLPAIDTGFSLYSTAQYIAAKSVPTTAAPPADDQDEELKRLELKGQPQGQITFENPRDYAFFLLGKRLSTEPELRSRAAPQVMMGRYGIHLTDVRPLAKQYYEMHKDVKDVGAIPTPDKVLGAAWEQAKANYGKMDAIYRALAAKGEAMYQPGKVTFFGTEQEKANPVYQSMKAHLEHWVTLFAPDMKLVIIGTGSPAMTAVGDVMMIRLPTTTSNNLRYNLTTVAHEFGHALEAHELNKPEHTGARQALEAEWLVMREKAQTWTMKEFLEKWSNSAKRTFIEQIGQSYGLNPDTATALEFAAAVDQNTFEGYLMSFPEWFAEQMARYTTTTKLPKLAESELDQIPALKNLLQKTQKALKLFFDKIGTKVEVAPNFKTWVDQLRLGQQPQFKEQSEIIKQQVDVQFKNATLQMMDEQIEYTLKVLDRLPNKEWVKRESVFSEMNRQDVREQEKQILRQVLANMEGQSINRAELRRAALEKVEAITVDVDDDAQTPYTNYGYHAVPVLRVLAEQTELGDGYSDHNSINVYRSEYLANFTFKEAYGGVQDLGPDPHFNAGYKRGVYAHVRHATQDPTYRGPGSNLRIKYLAEIQPGEQLLEAQKLPPTVMQSGPSPAQVLPKRWWEFVLRNETKLADKEGVDRVRVPTVETVSKIQGFFEESDQYVDWYPANDLAAVELKAVQTALALTDRFMPFFQSIKRDEKGNLNLRFNFSRSGFEDERDVEKRDFMYELSPSLVSNVETDFKDNVYFQLKWTQELRNRFDSFEKTLTPEMQAVLDSYARTIHPFITKEYGAKIVTDDSGDTWFEYETPDMGGNIQSYFEMVHAVDEIGENILDREKAAKLLESVPDLGNNIKRWQGFLGATLQLNQWAKLLPQVGPLQNYRKLRQKMVNLKNQIMETPNERIKEWYNISGQNKRALDAAFRAEVDGGKHWTELRQEMEQGPQGAKARWRHHMTEAGIQELAKHGVTGKAIALFVNVKNDYLDVLDHMQQALEGNVTNFYGKNNLLSSLKVSEMRKQFDEFRKTPWVPDRRFGQWGVVVRAREDAVLPGGIVVKPKEVVFFGRYESKTAQQRALKEMQGRWGDTYNIHPTYVSDQQHVLRSMPPKFSEEMAKILELTEEQQAAIRELEFNATKEGAFLKMLGKGKKHIEGASSDMRRSYADYMWRSANMVTKLVYARPMKKEVAAVKSMADRIAYFNGDPEGMQKLHEWLQRNYDYIMTPQHEWEQLRAITSLWYLWAVPKTALMNLTSLPVAAFAHLAAKEAEIHGTGKGDIKATKQLVTAMKQVVLAHKSPESWSQANPELAKVLDKGLQDGITNQSFAAELAGTSDASVTERWLPYTASNFLQETGISDATRRTAWKVIHMGMSPFRVIEQFNRETTLLAAFQLNRANGQHFDEAYENARDSVEQTQNDYEAGNKPEFLRGKKSIFLIFYSFVQSMTFFMAGGDKGWWRALIVLAALGGLQGLPGAENVADMLSWAWRKMTGQYMDVRLEARELFTSLGMSPDLAMHGLMHSTLGMGFDASSSVGFGRIIPGTDALFGVGPFEKRFMQMAGEVGGPFFSLSLSFAKALADDNPNAIQRFDRVLPPAIRGLERAAMAYDSGVWKDSAGRPVADATGMEIAGQALGFSPESKTSAQELSHFQHEAVEYYKQRRSNLMTMYYNAWREKDSDAMAEVKSRIKTYNSETESPGLRVTVQDLKQSVAARYKAEQATTQHKATQKRYQGISREIGGSFATT